LHATQERADLSGSTRMVLVDNVVPLDPESWLAQVVDERLNL
jgi:hypothetical protein